MNIFAFIKHLLFKHKRKEPINFGSSQDDRLDFRQGPLSPSSLPESPQEIDSSSSHSFPQTPRTGLSPEFDANPASNPSPDAGITRVLPEIQPPLENPVDLFDSSSAFSDPLSDHSTNSDPDVDRLNPDFISFAQRILKDSIGSPAASHPSTTAVQEEQTIDINNFSLPIEDPITSDDCSQNVLIQDNCGSEEDISSPLENHQTHPAYTLIDRGRWSRDQRIIRRLFYTSPLPKMIRSTWTPYGSLENKTIRTHGLMDRKKWNQDRRYLWILFQFPVPPLIIQRNWSAFGYLTNETFRTHALLEPKRWRADRRTIWLLLHYPPLPDLIYADGCPADPIVIDPVSEEVIDGLLTEPSLEEPEQEPAYDLPFEEEPSSQLQEQIPQLPIDVENENEGHDPDSVDSADPPVHPSDGTDPADDPRSVSEVHFETSSKEDPDDEDKAPVDIKGMLTLVLEDNFAKITQKRSVPVFLEQCMDPRFMAVEEPKGEADSRSWSDVFRSYALIGLAHVPKEKVKEALRQAELFLTWRAEDRIQLNAQRNEIICFAVIEYAKNWEYSLQPRFWDYMLGQFSLLSKDDDTEKRKQNLKYINLMKTAVAQSLDLNHRLVVRSVDQTQYKATILLHAMGQKQNWFEAFTFLYEYLMQMQHGVYTGSPTDLDGLNTLVYGLREFMSNTSDEMDVEIFKTHFVFPIALRKLIALQPEYTIQMMSRYLLKICAMISRGTCSVSLADRENELLEEWYRILLTRMREPAAKGAGKTPKAPSAPVRKDQLLTNARFSYQLDIDQGVLLSVSGAKGPQPFEDLYLQILQGDTEVYRAPLSWYSEEGSYRIEDQQIPLTQLMKNAGPAQLKARIFDDEQLLVSTETRLNREYWFFVNEKEISITHEIPDGLILIGPSTIAIQEELITSEPIDLPLPTGYFAKLFHAESNSSLRVENIRFGAGTLYSDDLQITLPKSMSVMPSYHTPNGTYPTVLLQQNLVITTNRNSPEHSLKVFINELEFDLGPVKKRSPLTNAWNLEVPFKEGPNHYCSIQVVDLIKNRSVYKATFFMLKTLHYHFNKKFYLTPEEFETGILIAYLNGRRFEVPLSNGKQTVDIPIRESNLRFTVPMIQIFTPDDEWIWEKEQELYIDQIPEPAILKIEKPKDVDAFIVLNGEDSYRFKNNQVLIGNIVHSLKYKWEGLREVRVELQLSSTEGDHHYLLGTICCKAHFKSEPSFVYQDSKIFWMGGHEYIGPVPKKLELQLTNGSDSIRFPMTMETEFIELPEDLPLGHYIYQLFLITGNVFKAKKEMYCTGHIAIGNPNEIRFMGKQIKLQKIKSLDYQSGALLNVYNWYIDEIHYLGTATDNEEDGTLHFYEGSLYTVKNNEKVYMSDRWAEDEVGEMTKINPVRLGLVNDSTLILTNDDQDGIYMKILSTNNKQSPFGTISRYEPIGSAPTLKLLDYALYDVVDSGSTS